LTAESFWLLLGFTWPTASAWMRNLLPVPHRFPQVCAIQVDMWRLVRGLTDQAKWLSIPKLLDFFN
jgi:hypothetical protein